MHKVHTLYHSPLQNKAHTHYHSHYKTHSCSHSQLQKKRKHITTQSSFPTSQGDKIQVSQQTSGSKISLLTEVHKSVNQSHAPTNSRRKKNNLVSTQLVLCFVTFSLSSNKWPLPFLNRWSTHWQKDPRSEPGSSKDQSQRA